MTPVIDPAMARVMARQAAANLPDVSLMPRAEGLAAFEAAQAQWNAPIVALPEARDLAIAGPGGPIPVRLYVPNDAHPAAVVIHAHGGGWTFGSLASHDRVCRLIARGGGVRLLAVDYRLAPEHPTPAGVDDVLAAIDAALAGSAGAKPAPRGVVLIGDSAGANLCLGALIKRRDQGQPPLGGAVLVYGCYAPMFETWSHKAFGVGFGLTTERMRRLWRNHLGTMRPDDPVAAPLHADLRGLPPLHLVAAGLDPLLDDTLQLLSRLAEAGVPTTADIVPGVIHGFLQMSHEVPAAAATIDSAARFIRLTVDSER